RIISISYKLRLLQEAKWYNVLFECEIFNPGIMSSETIEYQVINIRIKLVIEKIDKIYNNKRLMIMRIKQMCKCLFRAMQIFVKDFGNSRAFNEKRNKKLMMSKVTIIWNCSTIVVLWYRMNFKNKVIGVLAYVM
ncbi:13326_t:CDS:1, partial [Gigaspora margarita]